MNKEAYMQELESKLKGLDASEMEDSLAYCEEYFDEAGEGKEEQVIEELGLPAKFAAQIRAEAAIRKNENNKHADRERNPRTSMNNMVIIFLGICALPIALPLALTMVLLVFVFVLVIFILFFALVISAGAVIVAGIPLVIMGIGNLGEAGNAFISIGGGCIAIGFGLLLMLLFYSLIRVSVPAFTRATSQIYHKAKGGVRNEKAA